METGSDGGGYMVVRGMMQVNTGTLAHILALGLFYGSNVAPSSLILFPLLILLILSLPRIRFLFITFELIRTRGCTVRGRARALPAASVSVGG